MTSHVIQKILFLCHSRADDNLAALVSALVRKNVWHVLFVTELFVESLCTSFSRKHQRYVPARKHSTSYLLKRNAYRLVCGEVAGVEHEGSI